jgi:hypothetical protein
MTDEIPDMLKAALEYAEKGIPIFPVAPPHLGGPAAGKRPMTKNGFHDATADVVRIRQWWERHPDHNIGMPTGAVSGLWVLDVDVDKGGIASFLELIQTHGALPATATVRTGGGGWHFYFAYPGFPVKCSASVIAPGIDVRGDGGYVVAPPSLHVSGNRYHFEAFDAGH